MLLDIHVFRSGNRLQVIAWESSTIYGYACSPFTNIKYNHAMDSWLRHWFHVGFNYSSMP